VFIITVTFVYFSLSLFCAGFCVRISTIFVLLFYYVFHAFRLQLHLDYGLTLSQTIYIGPKPTLSLAVQP